MSIKNLSEPVRLEQLAEECAELGHVALKLSRILRAESPTPVPEADARKQLLGEIADVVVCSWALLAKDELKRLGDLCVEKVNRWENRLREVEK